MNKRLPTVRLPERDGPGAAAVANLFAPAEHILPGGAAEPIVMVPLDEVRVDEEIQARADPLDKPTVDRYEAYYREKGPHALPALTAYFDGQVKWLSRGFHREAAARRAGLVALPFVLKSGTWRDAYLDATGDNEDHGLPRTDRCRTRAVLRLLRDDEWRTWSDRRLAQQANVSPTFVGKVKRAVQGLLQGWPDEEVVRGERVSIALVAHVRELGPRLGYQFTTAHPDAGTSVHRGQVDARIRKVIRAGKEMLMDTTRIGSAQKQAAGQRRLLAAAKDLAVARRHEDAPTRSATQDRGIEAAHAGPDGTRDPRKYIDWHAVGRAWAERRGSEVPKEDDELRRRLAAEFHLALGAAAWGAQVNRGQPQATRDRALHALVEGVRRARKERPRG